MKKLPDDAFAFYLALGSSRSHQAVADHFGVDKKTVTNRAVKEDWKGRVAEHERKLREESEKKAHETVQAMDDRQLRVAGYIQGKAIEALKAMPLDSAMDAVKAYKLAVEMERMIRGKPNTQSVIEIEKKIREEHESWLVPAGLEPVAEAEAGEPQPESPAAPTIPTATNVSEGTVETSAQPQSNAANWDDSNVLED